MQINIKRKIRTNNSTIGELFVDGVFECYTLEDVERDVKIPAETAIAKGTYKVVVTPSNRFKRDLPLLLKVPNFEGVRIHSGNNNHNTEGCILVGQTKDVDWIGNSRQAFNKLFEKIKSAKKVVLKIE